MESSRKAKDSVAAGGSSMDTQTGGLVNGGRYHDGPSTYTDSPVTPNLMNLLTTEAHHKMQLHQGQGFHNTQFHPPGVADMAALMKVAAL